MHPNEPIEPIDPTPPPAKFDAQRAFESMLRDAVKETGVDLRQSTSQLAQYMNDRAIHLATISGQPGFDQALRAERNNIAMRAGIEIAHNADAADQRMIGLLQGALGMAVAALV